jgi:hypothetical protein
MSLTILRQPASDFSYFVEEQNEFLKNDTNISNLQKIRYIADKWRNLSLDERSTYRNIKILRDREIYLENYNYYKNISAYAGMLKYIILLYDDKFHVKNNFKELGSIVLRNIDKDVYSNIIMELVNLRKNCLLTAQFLIEKRPCYVPSDSIADIVKKIMIENFERVNVLRPHNMIILPDDILSIVFDFIKLGPNEISEDH